MVNTNVESVNNSTNPVRNEEEKAELSSSRKSDTKSSGSESIASSSRNSSCDSSPSGGIQSDKTSSSLEVLDGLRNIIDESAKTSLFCSVPLNKIRSVLSSTSGKTEEDDAALMKTKQISRKLLCLYCDRTFVSSNLRQKHVERCHSEKQSRRLSSRKLQSQFTTTACSHCDKLPVEHSLRQLFEHLISDHPQKYFGCLPCEERFLSQSLLNDHIAKAHSDSSLQKPSRAVPVLKTQKDPVKIEGIKEAPNTSNEGDKEPIQKVTRSMVKQNIQPTQNKAPSRQLRNKKIAIKASKIGLKRSKRLQAAETKVSVRKKRRAKAVESAKPDETTTKSSEKVKSSSANPYPEFDNYYRVKKITDHSIDNLKISSLTFDDVFDKAFFSRIKCNIQENLMYHLDGKLFKNEESENRISNFEKNPPSQDVPSTSSENFGCDLSLNAITPVTSILTPNFGEDLESQIEYGSKPSKKKLQTRQDPVRHKYVTRRKYQASILEHKENRDLSKLDMWTQLVIKDRQQKVMNDQKSAKEMLEYTTCAEYKLKVQRSELNRILDRRGPFEDLKEEASKKAALDKLNSESSNEVSEECFKEVRSVMDDLLTQVVRICSDNDRSSGSSVKSEERDSLIDKVYIPDLPDYLQLRRTSLLPSEEVIDKSDKIALICSSQETENYELPTNTVRAKNEMVELSGEWARSRIYVCAACGLKLSNMKILLEHKSLYHQNAWVQHYEFVGNQSELYRHLCIPGLGKVGHVECIAQCKFWRRSDARVCTKCGKVCNALAELHRHILECGGDWTWMLARKKCKYRPFGSRKKRRGLVKRIRERLNNRKTEQTEKKIYKKTFEGPRQRPSDADTIQRMLANLPPKRSSRKSICMKDGFPRNRKTTQTNNKKKVMKCGKIVRQKTTYKTGEIKTKERSNNQKNASVKKSLRSLNRTLSSKILDTSSKLRVKRQMIKNINKRSTRRSAVKTVEHSSDDVDKIELEKINLSNTKKSTNSGKIKRENNSNRVKNILKEKVNIKNFFRVSKRKASNSIATNEVNTPNSSKLEQIYDENEESNSKINKSTESVVKKLIKKSLKFRNKTDTEAKNNKKLKESNEPLVVIEKFPTSRVKKPDRIASAAKLSNKRKLRSSFRKVIDRVKKLKLDNPSSSSSNEQNKNANVKPMNSFLGQGTKGKEILATVLVPLVEDLKENPPSTPAYAQNAIDNNSPTEESLIPENIFNFDHNSENILQAKSPLEACTDDIKKNEAKNPFEIITQTKESEIKTDTPEESMLEVKEADKIAKSVDVTNSSPKETETITDAIVDITNTAPIITSSETSSKEMSLLSIETHSKSDKSPLVSPVLSPSMLSPKMKGKLRKPNRGLNDCIAMLTKKAFEETHKADSPDDIVEKPIPEKLLGNNENVAHKFVRESECILKIPIFERESQKNIQTEVLDLSKPKKNLETEIVKPIENVIDLSTKVSPSWNSVDGIIQDVIENKNQTGELNHFWTSTHNKMQNIIPNYISEKAILKIPKIIETPWTSVDDIIQKVIENRCDSNITKESNKPQLRVPMIDILNSVDKIIEEVVKGNVETFSAKESFNSSIKVDSLIEEKIQAKMNNQILNMGATRKSKKNKKELKSSETTIINSRTDNPNDLSKIDNEETISKDKQLLNVRDITESTICKPEEVSSRDEINNQEKASKSIVLLEESSVEKLDLPVPEETAALCLPTEEMPSGIKTTSPVLPVNETEKLDTGFIEEVAVKLSNKKGKKLGEARKKTTKKATRNKRKAQTTNIIQKDTESTDASINVVPEPLLNIQADSVQENKTEVSELEEIPQIDQDSSSVSSKVEDSSPQLQSLHEVLDVNSGETINNCAELIAETVAEDTEANKERPSSDIKETETHLEIIPEPSDAKILGIDVPYLVNVDESIVLEEKTVQEDTGKCTATDSEDELPLVILKTKSKVGGAENKTIALQTSTEERITTTPTKEEIPLVSTEEKLLCSESHEHDMKLPEKVEGLNELPEDKEENTANIINEELIDNIPSPLNKLISGEFPFSTEPEKEKESCADSSSKTFMNDTSSDASQMKTLTETKILQPKENVDRRRSPRKSSSTEKNSDSDINRTTKTKSIKDKKSKKCVATKLNFTPQNHIEFRSVLDMSRCEIPETISNEIVEEKTAVKAIEDIPDRLKSSDNAVNKESYAGENEIASRNELADAGNLVNEPCGDTYSALKPSNTPQVSVLSATKMKSKKKMKHRFIKTKLILKLPKIILREPTLKIHSKKDEPEKLLLNNETKEKSEIFSNTIKFNLNETYPNNEIFSEMNELVDKTLEPVQSKSIKSLFKVKLKSRNKKKGNKDKKKGMPSAMQDLCENESLNLNEAGNLTNATKEQTELDEACTALLDTSEKSCKNSSIEQIDVAVNLQEDTILEDILDLKSEKPFDMSPIIQEKSAEDYSKSLEATVMSQIEYESSQEYVLKKTGNKNKKSLSLKLRKAKLVIPIFNTKESDDNSSTSIISKIKVPEEIDRAESIEEKLQVIKTNNDIHSEISNLNKPLLGNEPSLTSNETLFLPASTESGAPHKKKSKTKTKKTKNKINKALDNIVDLLTTTEPEILDKDSISDFRSINNEAIQSDIKMSPDTFPYVSKSEQNVVDLMHQPNLMKLDDIIPTEHILNPFEMTERKISNIANEDKLDETSESEVSNLENTSVPNSSLLSVEEKVTIDDTTGRKPKPDNFKLRPSKMSRRKIPNKGLGNNIGHISESEESNLEKTDVLENVLLSAEEKDTIIENDVTGRKPKLDNFKLKPSKLSLRKMSNRAEENKIDDSSESEASNLENTGNLNNSLVSAEEKVAIVENDTTSRKLKSDNSKKERFNKDKQNYIFTKPSRSLRSTVKITYKQSNIFALQVEGNEIADLKITGKQKSSETDFQKIAELSKNDISYPNVELENRETQEITQESQSEVVLDSKQNGNLLKESKVTPSIDNTEMRVHSELNRNVEDSPFETSKLNFTFNASEMETEVALKSSSSKKSRKNRKSKNSEVKDPEDCAMMKAFEQDVIGRFEASEEVKLDTDPCSAKDTSQSEKEKCSLPEVDETLESQVADKSLKDVESVAEKITTNNRQSRKSNSRDKSLKSHLSSSLDDLSVENRGIEVPSESDVQMPDEEIDDLSLAELQTLNIRIREKSTSSLETHVDDGLLDNYIKGEQIVSNKKPCKIKKSKKLKSKGVFSVTNDSENINTIQDVVVESIGASIENSISNDVDLSKKLKDAFEFEDDLMPIEELSPKFKRRIQKDPTIRNVITDPTPTTISSQDSKISEIVSSDSRSVSPNKKKVTKSKGKNFSSESVIESEISPLKDTQCEEVKNKEESTPTRRPRTAKSKALENINTLEKKLDSSLDKEFKNDGEDRIEAKEINSIPRKKKINKTKEIMSDDFNTTRMELDEFADFERVKKFSILSNEFEKEKTMLTSKKKKTMGSKEFIPDNEPIEGELFKSSFGKGGELKNIEQAEIKDPKSPRKSRAAKAKALENIKSLERKTDDILDEDTSDHANNSKVLSGSGLVDSSCDFGDGDLMIDEQEENILSNVEPVSIEGPKMNHLEEIRDEVPVDAIETADEHPLSNTVSALKVDCVMTVSDKKKKRNSRSSLSEVDLLEKEIAISDVHSLRENRLVKSKTLNNFDTEKNDVEASDDNSRCIKRYKVDNGFKLPPDDNVLLNDKKKYLNDLETVGLAKKEVDIPLEDGAGRRSRRNKSNTLENTRVKEALSTSADIELYVTDNHPDVAANDRILDEQKDSAQHLVKADVVDVLDDVDTTPSADDIPVRRKGRLAKSKALKNISDLKEKIDVADSQSTVVQDASGSENRIDNRNKQPELENREIEHSSSNVPQEVVSEQTTIKYPKLKRKNKFNRVDISGNLIAARTESSISKLSDKFNEATDCYDISKIDEDENLVGEEPIPFSIIKNKKNSRSKDRETRDITCEKQVQRTNEEVQKDEYISTSVGQARKSRAAKSKALENIHDVSKSQETDIESEHNDSSDGSQSTPAEIDSVPKYDEEESCYKSKVTRKISESRYSSHEESDLVIDESATDEIATNLSDISPSAPMEEEIFEKNSLEMKEISLHDPEIPTVNQTLKKLNGDELCDNERTKSEKAPKFDSGVLDDSELKQRRRRACKVNTYNENDLAEAIFLQATSEKEKSKKKKADEKSTDSLSTNKIETVKEKKMNSDELFDLLKATATENFNLPKPVEEPLPDDLSDMPNDFTDDNFDNVFDDILKKSQAIFGGKSISKKPDRSRSGDWSDTSKSTDHLSNLKNMTKSKDISSTPVESNNTDGGYNNSRNSTQDQNYSNRSEDVRNTDGLYCDICNKSFKRMDNLVKHRTTLTHISKLSEIEAKQAEEKSKEVQDYEDSSKSSNFTDSRKINESDSLYSYPPTPGNDALKIAEIITNAFDKPSLHSDRNFSEITPAASEYRRYKSLGERKSFESDQGSSNISENLDNNPYETHISNNAGVILEKQISLLQNIIENRGLDCIDEISMSSYRSMENSDIRDSPVSVASKLEDSSNLAFPPNMNNTTRKDTTEGFLKPLQIEDISEDSVNLKNTEDVKARKVLNRDEELFLECCSLLKSGSEVSNFSKKSNRTSAMNNVAMKMSEEPDMFESKNLIDKVTEESSGYSRMATPLGDSFGDTSNSNTISSNWGVNEEENVNLREKNYFNFNEASHHSGSEEGSSHSMKFKDIKAIPFKNITKLIKNRKQISSENINEEKDPYSDSSSKMLTKGALKIFEGLKVSIPTEELNLDEVLNSSPPIKRPDSNNLNEKPSEQQFLSPKTPRSARKSKPVKNKQQFDDRFIFKVNKKPTHKDGEKLSLGSTLEDSDKIQDVYDFEETQDNTDVFAKPDFKAFRTKGSDELKNENIFENNYEGQTLSSSSSSTISVSKKSKTPECITKKKHMIMGRIFKNALKPKADEDIRDIPTIDHNELVENYVLSCSPKIDDEFKKPKMTEEEMNYLFDKLIDKPPEIPKKQNSQTKFDSKHTGIKKRIKMRCKKRQRSNSDSTDDEFGLNKIVKKKPSRKNAKQEDNSINLEQELKECIGVASRKSQRKCTSGKQNVLVEYWSSDESAFEAFLENHLQELSSKSELPIAKSEEKSQKEEKCEKIEITRKNSISKDASTEKVPKMKKQLKSSGASTKKKSLSKESAAYVDSSEPSTQPNRRKRSAAHPLYHWSSSSEDETQDLIEVKSIRDDPEDEYNEDRPIQHGWIVGDSPKKLVTMLAQAKGKKTEPESSVKEQGKKKNSNS